MTKPPKTEIYGQYASDRVSGLINDPTGTLDARGDGNPGFHNDGSLFDEGFEDTLGTHRIGEDVSEVTAEEAAQRFMGRDALKLEDMANAWLREHDDDYDNRDYA